ncbi:MAG TPA: glycosyltransferase [Rhizomicrobium sp.]|nr:glycosyltransferase [Rhizomicrobium sp.]
MTDRRFFVVTPVRNGATYLSETLASIDAQNFRGWTHYVVDGGSSDGTVELVQASMENEPRRHLIQGRDYGLYDGLFKGFEAIEADGLRDDDICLWLNADDLLAPWAFATMLQAFDLYDADWITGQPGQWDAEGRLVLVRPFGWYPRWCIRKGWFTNRCLGWIQQESTFFTARLLRRLPPDIIAAIRSSRLAGDFLLWRTFAEFSPLRVAPTLIGGFRKHGRNLSLESADRHLEELRALGAFLPPPGLGRSLRFLYWIAATMLAGIVARHPLLPPRQKS